MAATATTTLEICIFNEGKQRFLSVLHVLHVHFFMNALTAVDALMHDTYTDFTLSNARRFYSSMGNPLAVKGLTTSKTMSP